jgi:hypothetical protein
MMNAASANVPAPGNPEIARGSRPDPGTGFLRKALPFLLIAALTLVTYSRALRNGFVLDDLRCVVENPVLAEFKNVPLIFASDDAVGTGSHNPYYRPFTTLSFALDQFLYDTSALGYHVTNLLLHLSVSLLLYVGMLRLRARPAAAFLAALLFAVHPAHAEPVAYISARADLLCGLGLVASLLLYLRWRDSGSRMAYACSVAAFAIAVFSKIVATLFPFLLAVLAAVLFRGERRRWTAIVPHLLVVLVFLAIRNDVVVMKSWGEASPFFVRLANAGIILSSYLRNALFPTGLRLFYELPFRTTFFDPIVIAAWSILAGTGYLALATARRNPVAFFGTTWFFACLLPVSGLVIPLNPAMADRYLYVPLMGLSFALASILDRIPVGKLRLARLSPVAGVLLVVAAGMSMTTAIRVGAWRAPVKYWQAAVAGAPGSAYSLAMLGNAYKEEGRIAEAEWSLRQAIAIGSETPAAHIDLSEILLARGDFAGAERHLVRALELAPGDVTVLACLGVVYASSGRHVEARDIWESVVRKDSMNRIALDGLRDLPAGKIMQAVREDADGARGNTD